MSFELEPQSEQQSGWALRDVTRRQVLQLMAAGAGAGTLAAFLAACGSSDDSTATTSGGDSGSSGGSTATSGSAGASTATSASSSSATPAASAAANSTAPSGGNTAKPTGQATIAQGPEITNLDASMYTGVLAFNVAVHMLEPLLLSGDDLQPHPHLAERMELPDPNTIHLTLRQGVTFHNGDPLTVDDVVFTLQRVSGPDTKSEHKPYTKSVASVSALDDKTVEVKLSKPDVTFPGRLALIPIVSKKEVEAKGDEGFDASPVGTGAYKFVSWKRGDRVTMEATDNYWGGNPKIKTLVWRGIPEDSTRVAELQTGGLDIAVNIPTQSVPQLKESDKLEVVTANSLRTLFVILNTHKPPFDDVRMRQAVNYAIDKSLIVDGVLDGFGRPNSEPFGPEVFGYNKDLEGFYAYDPDKAKALMKEAGFEKGTEVKFFGATGRYLKDKEVEENIVAQLGEVGIKVNLTTLEFQAFFDNYITKVNDDMQMGFWSNANNTADADYGLALNVSSKGRGLYWSDPQVDQAIEDARQEVDTDKRAQMYHDMLDKIVKAAPWIFLYNQLDIYGKSKRLDNWKPRSNEMIYLFNASLKS
jgi:peptide/nickel transport system substrate-binding protein